MIASLRRIIGKDTVRATIQRVGLAPSLKIPAGKYSLGMRQRLGMAQAIMENPAILILDEPFNGLDKHGMTRGALTLIYEDAEGQEYRGSIDISTMIDAPVVDMKEDTSYEKPQMAGQWWATIAVGGVLAGILVGFLLLARKNKAN